MRPAPASAERALRKTLLLTALGIGALCAAVFVTMQSRAATAAPPALGELRIGVAPATLPVSTGERDYTNGGFEAVYAQELARHLGVPVRLVTLPHETQAQALRQGEVDLVLARASKSATAEPGLRAIDTGYRSGVSVAMRADTKVRRWDQLAGQPLCTSADNLGAQAQARQVKGQLKVFDAPAQALLHVRTGECAAALLDRSQLETLLAQKEWAKFSATLPATEATALQAWLPEARADLATPLQAAVREIGSATHWAQRRQTWASNVAFEVYFDQTGPDCH